MTHDVGDGIAGKHQPAVPSEFPGAHGLTPSHYSSPAIHALEIEHIFRKQWLCVGRVDEAPSAGDFFTVEVIGEPLIVVRDQDGAIHVHSAICRHRAMTVASGAGNTRSFVCPYHAWTYALDGRLVGAPEMDRSPGFDPSRCGLSHIHHEVWEGFLFINFDGGAEPLGPTLAGLSERIRRYDLANMKTVRRLAFDFDCNWNWKLMCDNFIEPYHHIGAHLKSLEAILPARLGTTEDTDGPYSVVTMRYRSGKSPSEDSKDDGPWLPTLAALTEQERGDFVIIQVFPSTLIALYTDHMEFYRMFPEGPERIYLEKMFCAPSTAIDEADFDAAMDRLVESFKVFRNEDIDICLAVQRGLSSAFARPGIFCHLEKPIWQFARYVDERVPGAGVR
jgi:phenylpropionate dioxygenase-like ring-hydroxylating dioxygenase large terminal subunit